MKGGVRAYESNENWTLSCARAVVRTNGTWIFLDRSISRQGSSCEARKTDACMERLIYACIRNNTLLLGKITRICMCICREIRKRERTHCCCHGSLLGDVRCEWSRYIDWTVWDVWSKHSLICLLLAVLLLLRGWPAYMHVRVYVFSPTTHQQLAAGGTKPALHC
jgi:hypothetical protein